MDGSASDAVGLRAVAAFEASKGAIALLAGSGLLLLWHADAQAIGDALARHLYLDPGQRTGGVIWIAVHGAETHLRLLAIGVLAYAVIRFAEAFGLWHGRSWAEWFGVASGLVYVPFDLLALVRRPGLLSVAMLVLNLSIVAYLARQLRASRAGGGEFVSSGRGGSGR